MTALQTGRWQQGGFTLIEVVVSITVLSLVMLLTVSGLRTLATTQVRLEEKAERNEEIRIVSRFLRDMMGSSVAPGPLSRLSLGGGPSGAGFFEAGANRIGWKAAVPMGENAGGRFYLRLAREQGDLVMRWMPDDGRDNRVRWNKATPKTLVDDINSLETAYRAEAAEPWLSEWPEGNVPRWVRIRVQKDERYWPDIVIDLAR
ncbi:MAG: prepilin-type N-terminal cleavage/methylation domain-containing protein [Halieaceae bacterium]|jgi:general secretion pathway protein J|nr:prepilin-type N-terminal cleavage/methylation domain-containing protein [Halieaceae bacterium]